MLFIAEKIVYLSYYKNISQSKSIYVIPYYWRFNDLLGLKICHFLFKAKAKNQLEESLLEFYLENFCWNNKQRTERHLIKKGFENIKWMRILVGSFFSMKPETQIKDYPEIIKRKSANIETNWNDGNMMEMNLSPCR